MNPYVYKKRGAYVYHIPLGDSIFQAAEDAVKASRALGASVILPFNRVAVTVDGSRDPEAAARECFDLQQQLFVDLRSPDKAAVRLAAEENARQLDQKTADILVNVELDAALAKGPAAVEDWLKEFVAVTGGVTDSINGHFATVGEKLTAAGYRAQEQESNSERYTDRGVFSRYLVGQALVRFGEGKQLWAENFFEICAGYDAAKLKNNISVRRPLALKRGP